MIRVGVAYFLLSVSIHAQLTNSPSSGQPAPAPGAANQLPDSTRLELVNAVEPLYPLDAVKQKLQGTVMLKAVVSESGEIEDLSVVSGDPMLVEAATFAVRKWKFKPFVKGGQAVRVPISIPFDFIIVDDKNSDKKTPDETTRTTADPTAIKIIWIPAEASQHWIKQKKEPSYPAIAKTLHVQGVVFLAVVVGKLGEVRQISILSGDPLLVDTCVDAIKQWRYQPYELNGQPVEIQTEVEVHFSLPQ
jgi:TonB family protein